MTRNPFWITLAFLIPSLAFGQIDSNATFLQSKGKWPLPIQNVIEVSTYSEYSSQLHGCFWPSIVFVSKTCDTVFTVFPGKVVKAVQLASEYAVIIRYGDYFTTYSDLSKVFVSNGDTVKSGDCIGELKATDDGIFKMSLLLKDRTKFEWLDPETWFCNDLDRVPRKKFDR